MKFARGELWWASVGADEVKGHEFRDTDEGNPHLYLIVSVNSLASHGIVVAVPGTSPKKTSKPTEQYHVKVSSGEVAISGNEKGLHGPTVLMCEQIRVMAVSRFRTRAGTLDKKSSAVMEEVESKICDVLRLDR